VTRRRFVYVATKPCGCAVQAVDPVRVSPRRLTRELQGWKRRGWKPRILAHDAARRILVYCAHIEQSPPQLNLFELDVHDYQRRRVG
jgi:hypothetical protein